MTTVQQRRFFNDQPAPGYKVEHDCRGTGQWTAKCPGGITLGVFPDKLRAMKATWDGWEA